MTLEINVASIDHIDAMFAKIRHVSIQLAGEHHRGDALLRRNLVDGDPRRRHKADRAGMAAFGYPLHEKGHVARRDAELVFKDTAGPQRGSLDVFRHADPFALEVGGTVDPGVLTHQHRGVIEAPGGEDRDTDEPVVVPAPDHHQLRHRYFGHVELGEAELPPEHFRGAEYGHQEIDAVGFDPPVDDRPRARIIGNGETELQIGHASSPEIAIVRRHRIISSYHARSTKRAARGGV